MSGRLPSPLLLWPLPSLILPQPSTAWCTAGNLDEGSKKRGGARSTRKPWAEAEDVQLIASQPVLYTAVAHRAWIAQNSFPWLISHFRLGIALGCTSQRTGEPNSVGLWSTAVSA